MRFELRDWRNVRRRIHYQLRFYTGKEACICCVLVDSYLAIFTHWQSCKISENFIVLLRLDGETSQIFKHRLIKFRLANIQRSFCRTICA